MPIETNEDPEIEFSPLSQSVTRDGITVRVAIYRVPELDARWSLEVIDQTDASTVWEDLFDTDEEAYAAFEEALAEEGIRGLMETLPLNRRALAEHLRAKGYLPAASEQS